MKTSLILKFVVLAILCYVAILPTSANASCERSECVILNNPGAPEPLSNGCAYYGGEGYTRACVMRSWQGDNGNWYNFCSIEDC